MENVNLILAILSNLAIVSSAAFAVIQYLKQRRLTRVSNAIEIAKHFANEMVDLCGLVVAVMYGDSEIKNIIEKHKGEIENVTLFNKIECKRIFSDREMEKYNAFIDRAIIIGEKGNVKLGNVMQDVLNQLEHCGISFNSGIADEMAVYQSLHQTIFLLMPCTYPWIASINDSVIDKYYTNLCSLYVRWNRIKKKAIKKSEKAKRRAEKYNSQYNKIGQIKPTKV